LATNQQIENNTAVTQNGNQKGILIYTDGASSGNPGPAGIGVVMRFGKYEKEISEYIGLATNNIAELRAIQAGLLAVKKKDLPVRIFTDSRYAYGVLALGWKAKANNEIVQSIKKTMKKFKNLEIVKVKGHAGDKGNERADFLATSAIKNSARK
jgi:ribonuclease HI